ncbi:MAG: 2-aminoethylphosphonate--pyruvate transaminase [Pirellulales bacterium]
MDADIPYLLLTPGPLTTSRTVKEVMLRDYCTWDDEYNSLVTGLRDKLVELAARGPGFTSILMQGSGTFGVEATIGSVIPPHGKLLVANNGAYGKRIVDIAGKLKIDHINLQCSEVVPIDPGAVEEQLRRDPAVTHVAMVHCETTTGVLNPAAEVGKLAAKYDKTYILDAMSSFAGIEFSIEDMQARYMISSANKCLQGVPGFSFIIADRARFEQTKGFARSLSLDLYDQWQEMENKHGKWRYTSPTHVVRALIQAVAELDAEGGIAARARRYAENHRILVSGLTELGFRPLVAAEYRSPIITAFCYPDDPQFTFLKLYEALKRRRFVIYPGKVSQAETFRVATIGHVFPDDVRQLVAAFGEAIKELGLKL